MTSNISVSVEKLSYTNSASPPLQWYHETTPGIVLMFSPPFLKVTLGKKVLDSVDMYGRVQEAEEIIRARDSSGVPYTHKDLPISAMIRPGQQVLGIMHATTKSTKAIRCVQLKFFSESDLGIARGLVQRAGVRLFIPTGSVRPSTAESEVRLLSRQHGDLKPISTIRNASVSTHSNLLSTQFGGAVFPSSPPVSREAALDSAIDAIANKTHTSNKRQKMDFFTESHEDGDLRPSTAPTFSLNQSVRSMMPPRRELPFPRPDSRDSSKTYIHGDGFGGVQATNKKSLPSNKRPSTAELPPLKQPTYATRSTTSKETNPQLAKLIQTKSPGRASSQFFTATSGRSSSTLKNETSRPDSSSLRSAFDLSDDLDNTRQNHKSLSYSKSDSSGGLFQSEDRENHRIIDLIRDASHSDGSGNLQSYAMQPQSTRDDLLNDFFIECIEDDAFMILCQDVASNWRRIGLGMQ